MSDGVIVYVKCPCCGWHSRLNGGAVPLASQDPAQDPLILYLRREGARALFPAPHSLTLGEAAREPEYTELVRRVVTWCWRVIAIAGEHGIIANGGEEEKP